MPKLPDACLARAALALALVLGLAFFFLLELSSSPLVSENSEGAIDVDGPEEAWWKSEDTSAKVRNVLANDVGCMPGEP